MENMVSRSVMITALLSLSFAPITLADEEASLTDAISAGKAQISFRYRFEQVNQDGIPNDGRASSLKTRVNYKSGSYRKLHVFVEVDDVSYIGEDKYNSTRNGETSYPVVADPRGVGINQAYLGYVGSDTSMKLGRQRINLDNQRFIGGVGWRQNEQTYDALSIVNKSIADTTLTYAYIAQVNRIFGPQSPAAGQPDNKWNSHSHLLNAGVRLGDAGKLSLYGYFLDFDDAAAASNRTIGLRFAGRRPVGEVDFLYVVEYADQRDYGDNPSSYSSNYYNIEAGLAFAPLTVKVGVETLAGSSTKAGEVFITPLATAHKFQGWADKFLGHPAAGIQDVYVTLSGSPLGAKIALTYHQFDADSGGANFGSEWDLTIAKKLSDHFSLLLKLASYDAEDMATDTTKTWLMLNVSF